MNPRIFEFINIIWNSFKFIKIYEWIQEFLNSFTFSEMFLNYLNLWTREYL